MLKYIESHKNSIIYYPLAIYWAILLFLTTLPGKDLPDVQMSDKIEHLLAFGGLAVLLKLALVVQGKYPNLKNHSSLYTLLIIGVYAGLDELHQLYIPGRTCDILDWTADVSGALIGVLVISFVLQYIYGDLVE